MRARLYLALVMLALGAGLLGAAAAWGDSARKPRDGGVFRVAFLGDGNGFDYIDPALSYTSGGWALLDTTCARLMRYPDRPLGPGFRLQAEVATGYPRVTNGGRTFTFTIRRGFRFSDRKPVRADAFAHAIDRTLAPRPGPMVAAQYTRNIVGADAVLAGTRRHAEGVVAKGRRLVITLKRPTPDFPAQTTMPFFCAVPPSLQADPEGAGAPLPAAGPYYVSQYIRGRRVVLRRNPFYGGRRRRHVNRFDVDLTSGTPNQVINRIEGGQADWGIAAPAASYFAAGLDRKYGTRGPRFFVDTGLGLRMFAFNTSRGLFRDNARLRRAVNYAIDRAGIQRLTPGGKNASALTDQYLPPGLPAFRNARIYPHGPDPRTAKRLANGHRRSGKVVLLTFPAPVAVTVAQMIQRNLATIGLSVEIVRLPPEAIAKRVSTPGDPWDLAFYGWVGDYPDPSAYLNPLFDGRYAGLSNGAYFDNPTYNGLLRRAARRRGRARDREYGQLDVRLARKAAPMLALGVFKEATFVSKRVDPRCIVRRPWFPGWALDLTAVCLK
jgi:peptide/nickel transport system substrate-binding protein